MSYWYLPPFTQMGWLSGKGVDFTGRRDFLLKVSLCAENFQMWVRSKIHQELRKSISLLGHWVDILVCWTKRKLLLVHQREHQQAEEVFDEVWLLNHCCTGQADETEPWAWGETNYKQVKSSKGSTSLILREPHGISSSHRDVVVKETQPGQKEINCFFLCYS